jgi:hypothetical protein
MNVFSPTFSLQFPTVDKNKIVVTQNYEGGATQCPQVYAYEMLCGDIILGKQNISETFSLELERK